MVPAGGRRRGRSGRPGSAPTASPRTHRDDLPQVVVGMAVTRDGIPVRVWSWPGNTGDPALIRQVKDDLREWTLAQVVWVADRGFTSAENRRYLQRAAAATSSARSSAPGPPEASRAVPAGPLRSTSRDNIRSRRSASATRRPVRDLLQPRRRPNATRSSARSWSRSSEEKIAGTDRLARDQAGRAARGHLHQARPEAVPARHPRRAAAHRPRGDQGRGEPGRQVPAAHSDPHLTAEDIALGYKQLLEVERGWRDMKQVLDLRPVYHRREDRIRAHVLLCWLALLLIRVAETTTGETWPASAPSSSACTRSPSPAPPAPSARPPSPHRNPPAAHRPGHRAPAPDPRPQPRAARNALTSITPPV